MQIEDIDRDRAHGSDPRPQGPAQEGRQRPDGAAAGRRVGDRRAADSKSASRAASSRSRGVGIDGIHACVRALGDRGPALPRPAPPRDGGLFRMGLDIPRVALMTGHKTWAMLRRYTDIKPMCTRLWRPLSPRRPPHRIRSRPDCATRRAPSQAPRTRSPHIEVTRARSETEGQARRGCPASPASVGDDEAGCLIAAADHLPEYATTEQVCAWLEALFGPPWTLAILLELGLVPPCGLTTTRRGRASGRTWTTLTSRA